MVLIPFWPKYDLRASTLKHDLSRMTNLLGYIGSPHLQLPPVIHIAGTNGKGSTASYLAAIFAASGLKAHVYTSPHLVEFNERIKIANYNIDDNYLFELGIKLKNIVEQNNVDTTFFEVTTAMAFLAFAQKPADVVILETGIGGRLDPTNVIANPLLSIITPISLDHTDYLGKEIEQIAAEKAGIIKSNNTCVISKQDNKALDVLLNKAKDQCSRVIAYGKDFYTTAIDGGFRFVSKEITLDLPYPKLKGEHQIINSATVIASLVLGQNKFIFSKEQLLQGLQQVYWPARIEKIAPNRYAHIASDKFQIWLDGAHNQHGIEVLSNWICQELKQKVIFIIGITKNRDVGSLLAPLQDIAQDIFTVPVESEKFSYSSERLTQLALSHGIKTTQCLCLGDALTRISNSSFEGNVIITGSLFLAADFLKLIAT